MKIIEALSQHESIVTRYRDVVVNGRPVVSPDTIIEKEQENGQTFYMLTYRHHIHSLDGTKTNIRGTWFDSLNDLVRFDPRLADRDWTPFKAS